MAIAIIKGDLFNYTRDSADVDAWGHGVNLKGVMGAGIALGFKERFPEMFALYKKACDQKTYAMGDVFPYQCFNEQPVKIVFNIFTQIDFGEAWPGSVYFGVKRMMMIADRWGIKRIAIPMIGAGLGGLSEEESLRKIWSGYRAFADQGIDLWVIKKE
jgi:O-acetyl-ADP-ribose deacetylase (regulator of RNase III)